jgi:hypothetical protein
MDTFVIRQSKAEVSISAAQLAEGFLSEVEAAILLRE